MNVGLVTNSTLEFFDLEADILINSLFFIYLSPPLLLISCSNHAFFALLTCQGTNLVIDSRNENFTMDVD